ncbi:BTAD domain-containing putative transcriptional regulator [Streptomyces sp. NPDC088785]|uniref:AfsR/SARP family transcriptional regulator n=1 Tax=Streptomyces sp. NPDC088785 TaxID=3365897 RepID=UPI003829DF7D
MFGDHGQKLEIRVLGHLVASSAGRHMRVDLAPKPRTVLALLCGNPGAMIANGALEREVWGEAPPRSAARNLHTYVMQVRRMLEGFCRLPRQVVADEVLLTLPGGYAIDDTLVVSDHTAFIELAVKGRSLLRDGELAAGMDKLLRALEIWRGPAFSDVATGPALEAQRRRLNEARLGVIETLSEARVSAGQYHEAIADLALCVPDNPFHEGLHFQYMRALALCGERARALKVFNALRIRLVADLGIEPGPTVQNLQRRILNSADLDQDPSRLTAGVPASHRR